MLFNRILYVNNKSLSYNADLSMFKVLFLFLRHKIVTLKLIYKEFIALDAMSNVFLFVCT